MVINPAFAQASEPVARIFAILAGYRDRILQNRLHLWLPFRPAGARDRPRKSSRAQI